ncbi:hypothetical protein [Halosimplex halobium]|uniref:hypothetical protein n=1 Tax=Halosimplex halobium TaxID=3396618 RepID=UPI003F56411C
MAENDPNYLSEIIFQRSLKQQLRFEFGFAPLLTTLVILTAPGGTRGAVIIVAVVSLVIMAFLRWLTFTGRFADENRFLQQTVRPVELCAIIGVIQIVQYGATKLSPLVSLTVVNITTLLAVIGTLAFIVFVEFVFHTYQLGWGSLFYLRYRKAVEETGELNSIEDVIGQFESVGALFRLLGITILGRMYMEVGYYVLQGAIPDRQDKYIEELAEFVQEVQELKSGTRNWGITGTLVLSLVVVLPVFVGIAWGLSLVLGTFGSLVLALITMRVVKHIVGFSYIAFGTLRFDQFITTNKRSIALLTGYTAIVYLMFFAPLST